MFWLLPLPLEQLFTVVIASMAVAIDTAHTTYRFHNFPLPPRFAAIST